MKKQSRLFLVTFLIISSCRHTLSYECDTSQISCCAAPSEHGIRLTTKTYQQRSPGRYAMNQVIGLAANTHGVSVTSCSSSWLSFTPGVRSTFRADVIAQSLFGSDAHTNFCGEGGVIVIQGSAIADRNPRAWLADQLYLPRNFDGVLLIAPSITTAFSDFDWYFDSECFLPHTYFRIHGALVYSRWNLGLWENSAALGSSIAPLDHPHGYFSPNPYEGDRLLSSVSDYLCGHVPEPSLNNMPFNTSAGIAVMNGNSVNNNLIKFHGLSHARMGCKSRSKAGLSEVRWECGWHPAQTRTGYFGCNIEGAVPTNSPAKSRYLFEPKIDNGGRWEVGFGWCAGLSLWECDAEDRFLDLYMEGHITHQFARREIRTFDLKGKQNSIYMLAARFEPNLLDAYNDQLIASSSTSSIPMPTAQQFAFEYAPVANLTTMSVAVSAALHADIVILGAYRTIDGFSGEFGYNFWSRSSEKLSDPCSYHTDSLAQKDTWALKGDARMFGYLPLPIGAVPAMPIQTDFAPIALSATESKATIRIGTNQVLPNNIAIVGSENSADSNMGIDHPQNGYQAAQSPPPMGTDPALRNLPSAVANTGNHIVQTSNKSVFLSSQDIDLTSTRSMSHTIFLHLNYTFLSKCLCPSIGIGSGVEFGCSGMKCLDRNNPWKGGSSVNCASSQWSLWVRAGLAL